MSKKLEEIRAKLSALSSRATPERKTVTEEDVVARVLSKGTYFSTKQPVDYFSKTLNCPDCNDQYLHHCGVEVFGRSEDATTGQHITLVGTGAETYIKTEDSNMRGNPSARRGGILIHFCCEACGSTPTYYFAQHKGNTLVGWAK